MNYRRSATTYAIFTAIVFTFDIVRQQPNLVYYFINYSALVCLNKNYKTKSLLHSHKITNKGPWASLMPAICGTSQQQLLHR